MRWLATNVCKSPINWRFYGWVLVSKACGPKIYGTGCPFLRPAWNAKWERGNESVHVNDVNCSQPSTKPEHNRTAVVDANAKVHVCIACLQVLAQAGIWACFLVSDGISASCRADPLQQGASSNTFLADLTEWRVTYLTLHGKLESKSSLLYGWISSYSLL